MSRWVANKLGLINFWYYDEEEFELASGHLLFRGSNGSGKSVTMQSFIPLLLDGNKSPERLDPFGSRARKIENYLLDEETNECTGYLYIEFKRQEKDQYLTIGMGLKAVKNKTLDSWYFLITDGRRIGKELLLYREAGEKLPLTKKQLENEIKGGGFFTTSQREYMRMINEQLFGFESVDNYEELLNLLINLRSPKLSKDFKPTEIYKILSNSLKILSEDDLRPMSEAMENMDSYQGNLESYKRTQNACKNIKYHYDAYNKHLLVQKAKDVVEKQSEINEKIKQKKITEENKAQKSSEHTSKQLERDAKEADLTKANEQYDQLASRQEVSIKKEIVQIENFLLESKDFLANKNKGLEAKKEQRMIKENQRKAQEESNQYTAHKIEESLENLEEQAELFFFQEGRLLRDEFLKDPEGYDFEYMDLSLGNYLSHIRGVYKDIEHYEKVKQEEDTLLEQRDNKEHDYKKLKKQAEEAQSLLLNVKEDYKIHFVSWHQEAKHMPLASEEKIQLFSKVDGIEEDTALIKIQEYLSGFYNSKKGEYIVVEKGKETERDSKKQEAEKIKEEIEVLKNAKEIEPDRAEATIKNRERLKNEGISYIPLYKAIDFKKGVTEEIKACIESALVSMGIIDALVVNEKDRKKALAFNDNHADKYLMAEGNMMGYNLSQYLEVDKVNLEGVDFQTVDQLLTGIYLDEEKLAYINEKGEYGLGILKGKADNAYEIKYIGASARKKHREALIKQKEEELYQIGQNLLKLQQEKEEILLKQKQLEAEYEKLPALEDLREALVLRGKKEKEASSEYEAYLALKEKHFECQQTVQKLKSLLYDKMQDIEIPPYTADFQVAIEVGDGYRAFLGELKILQGKLINGKQVLVGIEEAIQGLDEDIDFFLYEMNHKEAEVKRQEDKKRNLEDVLKTTHIDEIEAQLEWCIKIKDQIPTQLKMLDQAIGKLETEVENAEKEIEVISAKIEEEKLKLNERIQLFDEEYALGYVSAEAYADSIKCCKSMMDQYFVESSKTAHDYTMALMDALTKNGSDLREYGVKRVSFNERIDIKARIDSKEIGFYAFIEIINKYIEDTKMLISEEERRIFEEVLLNTISSKITSKIYLSKQWIDKINKLMESMKTSSSLKLSLKWVPKKAENEGQLDIGELLTLLERGDRCSDEDMKKITDHFGAKVKEGIRNYEGTGDARNYHTIIQEVLDYRKWYEFKLFFEKKNERKKELTNNDFFRFSGGEKAMSMYIPLFSAVYARYENARKDCPRIIAMDEAFAGVDESNIRDMFRLLEELDLDFIINSQVLWGDYDTVKDLAISEIIREENDTTVVVLRYHWNGVQKRLL